ncbi:MAG: hypothetical protein WKF81_05325 [Thermomicrobiales bacterium]
MIRTRITDFHQRLSSSDGRFELLVIAVTAIALVLRLVVWHRSWTQIDEPASVLAIEMVATKGIPLFPSNVLYLQGAFFSYLAAPLAWFLDGHALLNAAQLLYLGLAVTLVPITMLYTRYITSSHLATTLVGVFVACDPNLIAWSVAIRPYGLLAVETILTLYCFTRILVEGQQVRIAGVRALYWLPVLATIGTFTHIGYWLIAPGIALVALVCWGSRLQSVSRSILICSILPLAAPVAFVLLGKYVGVGNGTGGQTSKETVMGSHLFSFERLIDAPAIRWSSWTSNFIAGSFHESLPSIIVLCSGVLTLRAISGDRTVESPAAATLLVTHWTMILMVVTLVVYDAQPRYLLHSLPLGYIVIGWSVAIVWESVRRHDLVPRSVIRGGLAFLIILPTLANSVTAADWQLDRPGYDADYWEITAWVGEHYEDGQFIITSLPPAAWFWFPESTIDNQTYFLAGPESRARSRRYIKTTSDGEASEYWLGIPPITSVKSLCSILKDGAGKTWLITDAARLKASWAYRGEMAELILATTLVVHQGPDGSQARFVRPISDWNLKVTAECIFLNT